MQQTLFLADHKGQLRQFVSALLLQCGYGLVSNHDTETVIQKARELDETIEVLLSHVDMPGVPAMTGGELADRLNGERAQTNMLFISNPDSGTLVLNHVWHFLPSPIRTEEIKGQIRKSLRAAKQPTNGLHEGLTKREIEVLKLIAEGNSTKQIAVILGIAFKTAGGHRSSLMKKLGIHDSVGLARYAIRTGLIDA
ncbi:MAG: response regulator transcription factor [Bryobacteraceae bacterium]|jgi:DNA-binding NarL/FixJ family response regulator